MRDIARVPAARKALAKLVGAETLAGRAHILDTSCAAALCARIRPFLRNEAAAAS